MRFVLCLSVCLSGSAGLNLDAVNDVDLLEKTKATMLANEDIMRIIAKGNPDVVNILKDPDLKPLKSGQFAQMEDQMRRLAKKYGGGADL